MIICLSGFVIAGPTPPSIPLSTRNDITASLPPVPVPAAVGPGGPGGPAGPGGAGGPARYSPHHQHMLTHFAPPHVVHAGVGAAGSSGSDSSSHSASPPPALKYNRVRTLYACLGESEGELSFEPNQVITHVTASAEPGWLRGVLRGRCGLLPENYVQPLP